MYPFVVKVHYYNDVGDLERTHLLVYAKSFAEVTKTVEDYIRDIDNIKITLVGDSGQLFEVNGAIAKALIAGASDYKCGVANLLAAKKDEEEAE